MAQPRVLALRPPLGPKLKEVGIATVRLSPSPWVCSRSPRVAVARRPSRPTRRGGSVRIGAFVVPVPQGFTRRRVQASNSRVTGVVISDYRVKARRPDAGRGNLPWEPSRARGRGGVMDWGEQRATAALTSHPRRTSGTAAPRRRNRLERPVPLPRTALPSLLLGGPVSPTARPDRPPPYAHVDPPSALAQGSFRNTGPRDGPRPAVDGHHSRLNAPPAARTMKPTPASSSATPTTRLNSDSCVAM